jgi:uncharacterized protein YutE (UPF0331/DUF86 family)
MTVQKIKSQSIIPRIDGINKDIGKLQFIAKKGLNNIINDEDQFILTQAYLRQALEGVFHIGSHILSRIPGARSSEYKEIAEKLGQCGIVDMEFSKTKLKKMAGYRNRLTHFYSEITPEELFDIISTDLGDINTFLDFIKKLLKNPAKFNLEYE